MIKFLLWNIVEISTYLFETIIIYTFLRDFLEKKPMPLFLKIISPVVIFILLISVHFKKTDTVLVIALLLVLVFFATFLFEGSLKHKLFATLLLVVFLLSSEILTMISIMALSKVSSEVALEQGTLRLLGIIISKIILLILTKSALIYKKKRVDIIIPLLYWLALFSVPIISIIAIYAIFSFNIIIGYSHLTMAAALSAIGLMFSNITIFYLFDEINEKTAIKNKYNILERQIESQVKQYEAMDISNKSIRKIKHDMNNHLLCIQSLIKGDSSEAVTYINNLTNNINNKTKEIDSGNYIIDSLLNAKITLAEGYGIKVNTIIQIPMGLKINDVDSCIIFGNAIDNAIEACNRIIEGKKEINISLVKNNNTLVCNIKNTTNGRVRKNGNLYYSSKRDSYTPGIGLENIYNTIEKYNGIIQVDHKENVFELAFLIQGV